jgi:hypothetical protein
MASKNSTIPINKPSERLKELCNENYKTHWRKKLKNPHIQCNSYQTPNVIGNRRNNLRIHMSQRF